MNGLDVPGAQEGVKVALEEPSEWLQGRLEAVTHLDIRGNKTNKLLVHELEGNLRKLLVAMRSIIKTLRARAPEDM